MKFIRFETPGGTHVGAREVYLDVDHAEAVYPVISATGAHLVEIRMGNGREYVVVGTALGISDMIEEHVKKP